MLAHSTSYASQMPEIVSADVIRTLRTGLDAFCGRLAPVTLPLN